MTDRKAPPAAGSSWRRWTARPYRRRIAAGFLVLLGSLILLWTLGRARHGVRPAPVPNDVYLWQRQWTTSVADAVQDSKASIRFWHVLAAEMDTDGQWQDSRIDSRATALRGRLLVAVFRLDGHLVQWDDKSVLSHIMARLDAWKRDGFAIVGVEVDYDCPTAQLQRYSDFLGRLRARLPRPVALWITALPSWSASAQLGRLTARADNVVLQVHAVQNPRRGLFDARQAGRWVARFGRYCRSAWYVALPAYGSRVVWGPDGRIAAIESERSVLMGDSPADTMVADPAAVAAFIRDVERAPPPAFSGWLWFRLPTDQDRRAWSRETWRSVMAHRPLEGVIRADYQKESPGLYTLFLTNTGNSDRMLPPLIRIRGVCPGIGTAHGYVLDDDGLGPKLQRADSVLLSGGSRVEVAWLRCDQKRPDIHVDIP